MTHSRRGPGCVLPLFFKLDRHQKTLAYYNCQITSSPETPWGAANHVLANSQTLLSGARDIGTLCYSIDVAWWHTKHVSMCALRSEVCCEGRVELLTCPDCTPHVHNWVKMHRTTSLLILPHLYHMWPQNKNCKLKRKLGKSAWRFTLKTCIDIAYIHVVILQAAE